MSDNPDNCMILQWDKWWKICGQNIEDINWDPEAMGDDDKGLSTKLAGKSRFWKSLAEIKTANEDTPWDKYVFLSSYGAQEIIHRVLKWWNIDGRNVYHRISWWRTKSH